MNITKAQYERISGYFPVQRGNVKTKNRDFINAILYMAENGCKWRALPKYFGKWQTIYKRFSRWAKSGVMQRIFAALQAEEIIAVKVEVLAIDSTSCKVHPDAHGALKNLVNKPLVSRKAVGIPSFMWYPQMIRSSLNFTFQEENVMMHPKDELR
jgi:transposase